MKTELIGNTSFSNQKSDVSGVFCDLVLLQNIIIVVREVWLNSSNVNCCFSMIVWENSNLKNLNIFSRHDFYYVNTFVQDGKT